MYDGCTIKNPLSISKLFTFFKRRYPQGFFFKGESHDFYEVICVLSGEVGVTAGKRIFTLKTGEMTYHPPGEFHAIWQKGEEESEVIIFSFSAAPFPTPRGRIFSIGSDGLNEISSIYESVCKSFNLARRYGVSEIKVGREAEALLAVKYLEIFLLSHLGESHISDSTEASRNSILFSEILSVMEANISKALSAADIAGLCKISVATLEKTVYRYLGYGAMAHYNTLRLQRAHTMLLEGASVKETALLLGFSNQNYFSARFKKYYGYSPSRVGKEWQ